MKNLQNSIIAVNQKCDRIKFDYAIELFFKCPVCNEPLNMVDNSKLKDALRFKIEQLGPNATK